MKPTDREVRGLPAVLVVQRLFDHDLDPVGLPPLHDYLELVWLSELGPTATLLYRRLGVMVSRSAGPHRVDGQALRDQLGVGSARHRVFDTALSRLCMFGFATVAQASGLIGVRARFALANRGMLARRHPSLVPLHDEYAASYPLLGEWVLAHQARALPVAP